EVAQRRFLRVNPDNRLVADTLEREWNTALQAARRAEEEFEKFSQEEQKALAPEEEARIRQAVAKFREVWEDARTRSEDRKRMVRLLLEDVTLVRQEGIVAKVRFKGGATTELRVPTLLARHEWLRTPERTLARIRDLSREMTADSMIPILTAEGLLSAHGRPLTRTSIHGL
ncbi:resolvase domain-containing protein, partial [mine drainage metagenome]